jgi:hypothetical protein
MVWSLPHFQMPAHRQHRGADRFDSGAPRACVTRRPGGPVGHVFTVPAGSDKGIGPQVGPGLGPAV